jgi:hypothetical protein
MNTGIKIFLCLVLAFPCARTKYRRDYGHTTSAHRVLKNILVEIRLFNVYCKFFGNFHCLNKKIYDVSKVSYVSIFR